MKEVVDWVKKLSDRQKIIFQLRVLEGKTQRETAEAFGITTTRVHQLESIMSSRWSQEREPYSKKFCPFHDDLLDPYCDEGRCQLWTGEKGCAIKSLSETFAYAKKEVNEVFIGKDEPINKLRLTARLYNCLNREGYNTIQKILDNKVKLLQIRNFGQGCMQELKTRLKDKGVEL